MAGIIATVLSTARTVANGANVLLQKVDPGGGNNIQPQTFQSPGEDSRPLPGDSIAGLPTQATNRFVVVGSVDPINVGVAEEGEVRRYSRDSEGTIQATLHLLADGSIQITSVTGGVTLVLGTDGSIAGTNSGGNFSLESSGSFTANGAEITTAGDVVTASGVSLDGHKHAGGTYLTSVDSETLLNESAVPT